MAPEGDASAWALIRSIGAGSVPILLVQVITYLVIMLTIMRVGRESTDWLAAATLGSLVFNLFGLMLVVAPQIAMDTIAPQAFGAGRYAEVGLTAQRAFVTTLLFLLPASLLWAFAERALIALDQPPATATLAATFLRALIPVLPINAIFESTRRFLYAQERSMPPLYAALLGLASHFLWQELLVGAFGLVGGGLACVATHCTMTVALLLHLRFRRAYDPRTWPGVRPRLLCRDRRAARRFLSLSVAGILSLSEWVFWEFVCFRAGRFGAVALAVHGTAYSLVPLDFMVPHGLSIGLSNGVGRLLGAGEVRQAKRLTAATLALGLAFLLVVSTTVYLARLPIIRLYTSDPEVVEGALGIWPWLCLDFIPDGMFALLAGLNRGIGLTRRSAVVIVLVLWPFGLPLVLCVAQSVQELWRLMPAIYLTVNAGLAICFSVADWRKLADAIQLEGALATGPSSSSSSCHDQSADGTQKIPSSVTLSVISTSSASCSTTMTSPSSAPVADGEAPCRSSSSGGSSTGTGSSSPSPTHQ
jgi:MATE family multidrug resistance protein